MLHKYSKKKAFQINTTMKAAKDFVFPELIDWG